MLLAVALLATALLAVLADARPAAAHAALTDTSPAEGSVVAEAPQAVTLTFSERVAMSGDAVRVLDPDGERVDAGGPAEVGGTGAVTYAVGLRPGVPNGTYTVAWQAVSADSHPVSGAFTFSVGAPSQTSVSVPGQRAGGGAVGLVYDVARYAAYGGFVLLAGGAAFVLACWREGAGVRPVRRVVTAGWVTMTAATLVLLLLRHPYTTGGGLADAFDLGGLRTVLTTRTGTALVSRLLLLATSALFAAVLFGAFARSREERERRDLRYGLAVGGAVLAAGLATTWAMSEHASTGIQTGVAMPVDVAHLLAVAAWLGGLAVLVAVLSAGLPLPGAAVARFSRLAFGSVLVLVATGLYQSWRQVGSWPALTGTEYGRWLIAKVVLVAVLVGVAALSRRWTARLAQAPAPAAAPAAAAVAAGAGASAGAGAPAAAPAAAPAPAAGDAGDAAEDAGDASVAPERAAQLARQRAAVAAARRKRDRDADTPRAGLRRTVLAEAGVAAVLLAVTTVLTGTEPARTETAAAARQAPSGPVSLDVPFDTGAPGGRGTARLDLDPGGTGVNTLHVRTDVAAEEVRVAFTLPARGIGPLSVVPDPADGTGQHWSAPDVRLPMPGEWEIAVTVRTSDIDQVTEKKNVTIG
ncbi:copper resistance protein CopC [Streptomyces sp. TRM 70351]|nr:copper resistance protein CopC [Streptomyces sp. TRM 70351]MEE1929948.1 copper resistance protein CopC [Streptomyces sp. TRM 70351]